MTKASYVYSVEWVDQRTMVCLLPFFDLFFNVIAYYFLALLDILEIKNRFLISCESIGGHNIVPPVTDLAIVDGYIPERSLN